MSHKASLFSKGLKVIKAAISHWSLGDRHSRTSNDQVKKWLAGEGKNFITMATL